jgi:membrane-associated phospholipid phosphatase
MTSQTKEGGTTPSKGGSLHKDKLYKTKILIVFFTVFMTLDIFFRESLFKISVEHQMLLRHSEWATPTLDKLARVISELGDKYVVGLMVYLSYQFLDHPKAFIIIFAAIICQSFSTLLKAMYHEARPFFVADTRPNGCRFEYGNPSGHSFIGTGLYLTIWDLAMKEYPKTSRLVRVSTFCGLWALIIILGASRVYNGVHTYNQVYAGLGWGLVTYGLLCHILYN